MVQVEPLPVCPQLFVRHSVEVRPVCTQLSDEFRALCWNVQVLDGKRPLEHLADCGGSLLVPVSWRYLVRLDARLCTKEQIVHRLRGESRPTFAEDSRNCGVEVAVPAEDPQRLHVVRRELVVGEGAHLDQCVRHPPSTAVGIARLKVSGEAGSGKTSPTFARVQSGYRSLGWLPTIHGCIGDFCSRAATWPSSGGSAETNAPAIGLHS